MALLRFSLAVVLPLLVVLTACGVDGGTDLDAVTLPDVDAPDTAEPLPDVAPDLSREDGLTEDAEPAVDLSEGDSEDGDLGPGDMALSEDTAADTVTDGEPSSDCRLDHAPGTRYSAGDNCNFCECGVDGIATCTARVCRNSRNQCEYGGTTYSYGERFDADDGCNVCVCAASGLACTRRCSELPEQGAILLESLDEACGDDPDFTGAAVLANLPSADITGPFTYDRERALYPESLPDSTARLRITREDEGFIVCRIPSPTQPAIDMEAVVEFMTEDGAFDEGFHAYLRRNNFGFVDGWSVAVGIPEGGLDGSYAPNCPDHRGFAFAANINIDGTVLSDVLKICDVSIAIEVGRLEVNP